MTKMVLSEWGGRIEFWFFALLKRSTHFSEYVVSEGAGFELIRVEGYPGPAPAVFQFEPLGRIPGWLWEIFSLCFTRSTARSPER